MQVAEQTQRTDQQSKAPGGTATRHLRRGNVSGIRMSSTLPDRALQRTDVWRALCVHLGILLFGKILTSEEFLSCIPMTYVQRGGDDSTPTVADIARIGHKG